MAPKGQRSDGYRATIKVRSRIVSWGNDPEESIIASSILLPFGMRGASSCFRGGKRYRWQLAPRKFAPHDPPLRTVARSPDRAMLGDRQQLGGDCAAASVADYRHSSRTQTPPGTFGSTEITVPGARLETGDGKASVWKSKALRAYQRWTEAADALIVSPGARSEGNEFFLRKLIDG